MLGVRSFSPTARRKVCPRCVLWVAILPSCYRRLFCKSFAESCTKIIVHDVISIGDSNRDEHPVANV